MRDTVFALATAPGRSALAVVRLSGPACADTLRALTGALPAPRRAALRRLRDAAGRTIDRGLVLWFPAPASFTGEDQAELHLHGGRAVIAAALEALEALGLRPADPGEFTRRAFENGKLELSQAEAVADLIDAETQAQRRQALDQLGGALERRYAAWRATLIEVAALLEASLDFPDEALPEDLVSQARGPLDGLGRDLRAAIQDARGEQVRDGYRVALVGAPNAGKSSLLNALAGRDAAIVTEVAGTTRDVIEMPLTVQGYRVWLCDMAGLRPTCDRIEVEGVRRARAVAEGADLRLLVVDRSAAAGAWEEAAELATGHDILVLNKADRPIACDGEAARVWASSAGRAIVETVAADGGVGALRAALDQRIVNDLAGAEFPSVTQMRHRRLLLEALEHVDRALALDRAPELVAEDVRMAGRALSRLSGRIDAEDVLDQVFARFCIGK